MGGVDTDYYHDSPPYAEKMTSPDDSDCEYSTTSSRYSIHSDTRILSASRYPPLPQHTPILASPRHFSHSAHHAHSAYNPLKPHSRHHPPPRIRLPFFSRTIVCTPRRFSRFFFLLLLAGLVVTVTLLTKLSFNSTRSVGLGLHRPKAPPPPWQKFPFLKRYHGGIRSLISSAQNVPEYPTTKEHDASKVVDANLRRRQDQEQQQPSQSIPASVPFSQYPHSDMAECFIDDESKSRLPDVRLYNAVVKGMPDSVMGSHALIGLDKNVCFDRFGRLGPYGFGYSKSKGGSGAGIEGHIEGAQSVWSETGQADFRSVHWNAAQRSCLAKNAHRLAPAAAVPRKAILVRTWNDYEYDDEDLFYLRALTWELSLKTGGEYTVHFLIHVRDENLPIWADDTIYNKTLHDSLPPEFRGMGTLWSETQMRMIYNALPENAFRDLPLHGAYRSLHMPLAWFSHQHPEFEYIWHFEMDMRYTGHYYHLVSAAESWAAKQPRKGLWERNARFYVPSEHGSWEDFSHMVRVQTDHGTASKSNLFSGLVNNPQVPDYVKEEMTVKAERAIWGPERPSLDDLDNSTDVTPPRPMSQDKYEWGVGEEADLMLFNPLFDPQGTNWLLSEDTTGYNTSHGQPPRRTAVTTFGRYSRRLLTRMHRDMAIGAKHMFTEMFPATTALHHGYKAVYVPHPVYIDRRWPTDFLAATFNGGRNGQSGGSRLSVFSEENEHNFRGVSWYYNAGFAPNLWHRWLGYKVDNDGGEAEEVSGEGRMCLPAMLVHPVKQVDLIYQEMGAEEDGK